MSPWEQRYHPLREEWVIVAAHRQNRPWIGETVIHREAPLPAYVPDCTFCPGNTRVSGQVNATYVDTFVFDNDAPCVGEEAPEPPPEESPIFRNRAAKGIVPKAKKAAPADGAPKRKGMTAEHMAKIRAMRGTKKPPAN